jgi:hypothetical protein
LGGGGGGLVFGLKYRPVTELQSKVKINIIHCAKLSNDKSIPDHATINTAPTRIHVHNCRLKKKRLTWFTCSYEN